MVNPYAHTRPKVPKKPKPPAATSLSKPEQQKAQQVKHIGAKVKKHIKNIMNFAIH